MKEQTAKEYLHEKAVMMGKARWTNRSDEEKRAHMQMMVRKRNEKRLKELQTTITVPLDNN